MYFKFLRGNDDVLISAVAGKIFFEESCELSAGISDAHHKRILHEEPNDLPVRFSFAVCSLLLYKNMI